MKRLLGSAMAWVLYWLGDLVSRCMDTKFTCWLYPAYNKLMIASFKAQELGEGKGPWEDVTHKKQEGAADES